MNSYIELLLINIVLTTRNHLKKLLEQMIFITRPKIEEHTLIFWKQSTHEEHFLQPVQTNTKKFKIGVTFLTGFSGFFKVSYKNKNSTLQYQLMMMILIK